MSSLFISLFIYIITCFFILNHINLRSEKGVTKTTDFVTSFVLSAYFRSCRLYLSKYKFECLDYIFDAIFINLPQLMKNVLFDKT